MKKIYLSNFNFFSGDTITQIDVLNKWVNRFPPITVFTPIDELDVNKP